IIQKYLELNPQIQESLQSSTQEIIASSQFILKNISMGLLAFLGALPGVVTVTVITAIATLLTSMNYPAVQKWFLQKFKGKHVLKTKMVASDLGKAMVGFIRAQLLLVALTMLITTVGLLLIGNEYAFTIGILTGLLDLVPIIGPAIIFIPWGLVLLFTGAVVPAIKILLIYAVTTVVRRIVEPKILADNIGIHPLPTLVSMYAGLSLFGAWGLILGPTAIIVYESMRKAGFFHRA
ncbi:MAG: sporulation integral membrane protein YtvI, partial [Peptococcaceae bacterium]|nr:sporulation integral membrane protein YtvI [Peptococcaceae bacterium]